MKTTFISLALISGLLPTGAPGQWVQTNGPYGYDVSTFAVASDTNGTGGINLFAGTLGGGVFRSTNDGSSWIPVNAGLANGYVNALAVAPGGGGTGGTSLFAGTDAGIFRSTNDGAGWTPASTGLTNGFVWSLAVSGTDLFAGTYSGGVFRSTNNGTTWSSASAGLTNNSVRALAVSSANLFAGTGGGGVFRSTDNGATWNGVSNGLTYPFVYALVVGPAGGQPGATNLLAGTGGGGVFRSTNNGTTWTVATSGLTNTIVDALAAVGTTAFAGTQGGGVFLSTDRGANWTDVNTGLTYPFVLALVVSGTNLFAGTWGGVCWRRPLSEMVTSVDPAGGQLPAHYSLDQNYPNPFNPSTNIQFTIVNPRPSRPMDAPPGTVGRGQSTIVKVYDILGREVATLVDDAKEPGTYTVQWDASGVSTGVYFYRLKAGDFVQTKRMTVAK